jgi:hypothetical protein
MAPSLDETDYLFAKRRVGKHLPKFVSRDSLEYGPCVLGEFPKNRIKLLPYVVCSVIPGPAHVQGKLGQGTESLDVRR